jgi:hypothetical protein
MKKLHFLFLVAVALFAFACNSKTESTTTSNPETAKTEDAAQPDVNNEITINLSCRELESMDEGDGVPLYEVSLVINGKETPVDSATACGNIGSDMYDQYKIPANAQHAVGGWFAGGGDYYYLRVEGTDAIVMYGWADEGAEPGTEYQYQEIKRVSITPSF